MVSKMRSIRKKTKTNVKDLLDTLKISEEVYFKLETTDEKEIPLHYLINLSLFYGRPISDFISNKKYAALVEKRIK